MGSGVLETRQWAGAIEGHAVGNQWPGRIEKVGIENLTCLSEHDARLSFACISKRFVKGLSPACKARNLLMCQRSIIDSDIVDGAGHHIDWRFGLGVESS